MDKELRILVVEDVPADAELEMRELKRAGLRVAHRLVETEEAFRSALNEFRPEVILSDFTMPHFDGMFALALAHELAPDVPFIFVSGTIGEEYAIRALKNGATDYVLKNNLVRLPAAVERAMRDARDISERRRAEARLLLQGAALDAAANAMMITHQDGTIRWVNRAFSTLTGYSAEEAIGQNPRILNSGQHEPGFYRRIYDTILAGSVWRGEIVNRYKDGRLGTEEMTITPVRGEGGEITHFIAINQDITARKEAEKHRARLSAILEASPDFVATADPDSKVLYLNRAARRLLELPEDVDASQVRIGDTHPPWAAELVLKTGIPTAIRDGVWSGETAFLTPGGREVPVIQVILAHKGADGSVEYLSTIAHDISERKTQELKIARLNRIHAVLSGINSAIVHIRDRQQLFEEACRIAVEHGKFTMSWIGILDEAAQAIRPVAKMGREEGYLERLNLTIAPNNTGNLTLAVEAVGRRVPVVCNDIATDGRMRPWRTAALERGYCSSVTFPLMLEQQAVGVFVLYAPEPGFFDEEEMKLLTELAGDISFALEHIAGQEKIEKLARVRAVSSGINAAIVRAGNRQELLDEACRIAVEQGRLGFAWIGSLDPATLDITPVAWAGEGSEEMRTTKFTARDDPPRGQGAVSRAVRERRAIFNNDIFLQTFGGPRRDAVLKLGFRSMIALPLFEGDAVVGTLTLYAKEAGVFNDDEIALLAELANNVSFALEHMARQQKIEKLSRVRALSSEINAAIVRIHEREALLKDTCRIAVEHGKFRMIWIGMLDRAAMSVLPVAWAGLDADYMRQLRIPVRDDGPAADGTTPRALRSKQAAWDNNFAAKPELGYIRRYAIERGVQSAISLPLVIEGEIEGVISLYAEEPGFFTGDEIRVLEELASNVSLALEHMAQQQKIEKLSRIRMVSGEINAAIVRIRERETLLRETCRIAVEHGKFELVWVGLLDEEKKEVKPVAWTGFSEETARAANWASISTSKGTLGEAIQTRKPSVRNDIEAELPGGKLRQEALQKGCHSTASLPLVVDDNVVALILLCAPGVGFFDTEELALLNEVASDISFALQSISRQEKLDYLSYYDALTELPNRQLFVDRLSQQMHARGGEQRMVALILFDLERFRNINDTLGRHSGDELLRLIARRLERAFNGKDYLAHIGADSFGAVIRGVRDAAEIAHAVESHVLGCFRDPFVVDGREVHAAPRAGLALFPGDGGDVDTLFKNAEAALKKAKASGERYLFYAPQMNARVAEQMKLENDLHDAMLKEQYVLHYQPKFDLASGRMVGMEALIRWNHPERGLVPPGSFVPVLEETGKIIEVGSWALKRAALEHAAWSAAGLKPPRIAVNVSPAQLRRKDFVEYMKDALAAVQGAADRIDIEITESMLMDDIEGSIVKLKAVQSLGLNVAVDDFGTGFSSLSYLARLPINSLKIDRSFIVQMNQSPEQMAIVSTVISLARALNLKVVAEGVETEEQANLLRLLRCDEAQGYLFGKPLPPEEMEKLLRPA